jgi:hypothetical protein
MAKQAPAATGAVTYYHIAYRFIDASGDRRTVSSDVLTADYTAIKAEALAVALGANSNASLFETNVKQVWASVPDKDNAVNAPKDSVFDNIVILLKNATNQSINYFLPAPDDTLLVGDGAADEIDPAEQGLADILAAILALHAGYSVVSARYTERREINQAVAI